MKLSKEFSTALSKAQGEIKHAKLDSKNPHFKSDYASLEAHIDNIKPALAKHGLSLTQGVESKDGQLWLTSRLIFGEEMLETGIPLIIGKNDMQGLGSAISYARRYSVAAMFNMGSGDDDGNAAVAGQNNGNNENTVKKKPITPPPVEPKTVMTQPVAAINQTHPEAVQDAKEQNKFPAQSRNLAPQTKLESYKIPFDFGTVKLGTTFAQLGIEGVYNLRSAAIRFQNSQEDQKKSVSPKILEFIQVANEFLKGN